MGNSIIRVCFYLVVSVFVAGGLAIGAFGGIIIEQVGYEKGSSQKNKETLYVSKNKVKSFSEDRHEMTIFDLNTGEMILTNNEKKTYVIAKPEELFQSAQDAMAKAKAQMEEQMSKLPPEQRAKIEEMMKSHGMKQSGGSKPENLTLKATGTTEDIAGYKSQKFEIYKNGKLDREIWTSKDVISSSELDPKKMADYMKEMQQMAAKLNPGKENTNPDLSEETRVFNQIFETGFPMKSVDHFSDSNAYIEEVVSVTKADISDKEFQPPAGFKKVMLQQMMSGE
ncbi:MAG: hypothetical protein C4291_00140 [Candidatus Dadabacteria bacterium]